MCYYSSFFRWNITQNSVSKQRVLNFNHVNKIILTITKLTNDTAFNVTFQKYINPPISTTIIIIVITTIKDAIISNPIKKNVARKIASNESPKFFKVSGHMVKYCSKNT
uniref:Uncharacterized protein n=1 Tax=Clastoptera arizonana TaxID=38151 RepID=A0A1B6D8K5_9HEMI